MLSSAGSLGYAFGAGGMPNAVSFCFTAGVQRHEHAAVTMTVPPTGGLGGGAEQGARAPCMCLCAWSVPRNQIPLHHPVFPLYY